MSMTIDCDTCAVRETNACDDCVVSYILSGPVLDQSSTDHIDDHRSVVVEASELFALRRLQAAGLVPDLRYCEETAAEIS